MVYSCGGMFIALVSRRMCPVMWGNNMFHSTAKTELLAAENEATKEAMQWVERDDGYQEEGNQDGPEPMRLLSCREPQKGQGKGSGHKRSQVISGANKLSFALVKSLIFSFFGTTFFLHLNFLNHNVFVPKI